MFLPKFYADVFILFHPYSKFTCFRMDTLNDDIVELSAEGEYMFAEPSESRVTTPTPSLVLWGTS